MFIRELTEIEIAKALQLVWEVFQSDIAPNYTQEGIGEFQRFLDFQSIMNQFHNRELTIWGALEGEQLLGVSALRNPAHISMLYVKKEVQGRGIGKALFFQMQQYVGQKYGGNTLTVNAAPDSTVFYEKMGFVKTSPEQQLQGIRFTPLKWDRQAQMAQQTVQSGQPQPPFGQSVSQSGNRQQAPKGMNTGLKATLIVIVCAAIVAILGSTYFIAKALMGHMNLAGLEQEMENEWNNNGNQNNSDNPDTDGKNKGKDGSEDDAAQEKPAGIEAIPVYKADNLSYSIDGKTYTDNDQKDKYYIEFSIQYPEISGLETDHIDQINKTLKETAMTTERDIYESPDDSTRDAILAMDEVYLIDYVEFSATYQSDSFISIAYNDQYWPGDIEAGKIVLRTANINLSDGTNYEIPDIVDVDNDQFMEAWYKSMQGEAENARILSQLNMDDFKQILKGKDKEYTPGFFVDKDGLEIGFSYTDDEGSCGWITAPFTQDEIAPYKTDSTFWQVVDWK